MAGSSRYNWDEIRRAFITGNMTLKDLSRESTGNPDHPAYGRIRIVASTKNEDWDAQRRAYRNNLKLSIAGESSTKLIAAKVDKLIDAAEIIASHLQISKGLKAIARLGIKRILENPDLIKTVKPTELVAIVREATNIERLAFGLSTSYIEHDINWEALTEVQLEAIANGTPIEEVISEAA